ncbi:MAG: hypothetical protein KAQ98_05420 [Bacteriovoracaceae bacterium]|nr:hypothetical protein [Bacteriovoracaceae bacterium]
MKLKYLLVLFTLALCFAFSLILESKLVAILIIWAGFLVFIRFSGHLFFHAKTEEEDHTLLFFKNIFVIAFLIRITACVILYHSPIRQIGPYFFAPDSYYYAKKGWVIAQLWLGNIDQFTYDAMISSWGRNIYFKFHALCYYVVGEKIELLPASFNCLAGAILPIISYFNVREFGVSKKCARWVATLICFWPSLILWSCIGIRDIWSILAFNTLLLGLIKFTKTRNKSWIILMGLCLLLIFAIRAYLLPLTLIALFASFFISNSKNIPLTFFLSLVAIVLINQLDARFGISAYLEPSNVEFLRGAYSRHGSGFQVNADLSSPLGYIKLISVSLVYYLFAPFPWAFGSKLSMFAMPETLSFYVLFYFIIKGIRLQIQVNIKAVLPLLLLVTVISCSYALVEANVGTLYRHKAQVVTMLLLFGPIGFYYRKIPLRKKS